ncbi:MAG: hypothetical protein ACUVQI_00120 [Thermochromatium sp.]
MEFNIKAEVQIGYRCFKIRQQLLDDLDRYAAPDHIRKLRCLLLVLMSCP